jgi:transglutaminase-like putative cysteine protease
VIYNVRHRTTYRYSQPVTFARCVLRLTPRVTAAQTVLESAVSIHPRPARSRRHIGPFGEQVMTVAVESAHTELTIEARCRVEVNRPPPLLLFDGFGWEAVREQAFASSALGPEAPAHFLYPTKMTPILSPITAYGLESFQPDRSIVEAASELMGRIKREFVYDPEATAVSTPIITAFEARRGVCQDFTHIMIAALRGIGLPAAYVTGYLRTIPPPGKRRLEGADATHAWVWLWCGETLGWIGFDPTNDLIVAGDHIMLAVGRDSADTAPIDGVILGAGEQKLKVAVDVVPAE